MHLNLEWMEPVILEPGVDANVSYRVPNIDIIPQMRRGVYIFARRDADDFEALYVGRGMLLRRRINQQFNNHNLMAHLQAARDGDRVLHVGLFRPRRAQQFRLCLPIIERALIRHYLGLGHNLLNVHHAQLYAHCIKSGQANIPPLLSSPIRVAK